MLWVCRECGVEVDATDAVLVATIGWTALDGDTGVCAPCNSRPATPRSLAARASAARIELSSRAVAISRARIARSRQPRWDERLVEQAAARLGFELERCDACAGAASGRATGGDSAGRTCAECEGEGEVYRSGEATVSRSRLLTLAMWPF